MINIYQVRIIYMVTTFFLVALSFYAYVQINKLIDSSDWIDRTSRVTLSLEKIRSAVISAETNQKSFLLTGDTSELIKFDGYFNMLKAELNLADSLTRDNPEQRESLKSLNTAIDEKLLSMKKVMSAYTPMQSRLELKLNLLEEIRKTERIIGLINKMSTSEKQLREARTQEFTHLAFISPLFRIVLFLGALFILWVSYSRINKALQFSQRLQLKVEESNRELENQNEILTNIGDQFFKIFDNNPVAMAVAEIGNSQIVYANKHFYTSFGYTKEEVIGHTSEELNLTSKEESERLLPIIMSLLEEERSVEELKKLPPEETAKLLVKLKEKMFENGFEILYTRKNGQTFFSIVFFEVIDIGNKQFTLTSYLDITERKNMEKQLAEQKAFAESVIEHDPAMILAYDENLKIIAWNKKTERFTGFKKEDVLGKYPYELFPEYKDEQWMRAFNAVLKEGKTFHYPKLAFKRTKGFGEFWLMPLRNAEERIIGILSITSDITEAVEITLALEQKNKELEKINKELESINYISSHDIQEPLRHIQIFAARISDTEQLNLSDKGKTYFFKMNDAAKRMQNLINDLLAYSRTKTEARSFKTINLNEIVNEVKEEFAETIAMKNATIESGELGDVYVIPFQFKQMIANLIGNALKFSKPDTPPHITITSQRVKSDQVPVEPSASKNEFYHIRITDNGIGFDPHYKDRIFEVFQRLHEKQKFAGTGIGLSIVKNIVENHGGIITATGELNKGATFDIYIPAIQSH